MGEQWLQAIQHDVHMKHQVFDQPSQELNILRRIQLSKGMYGIYFIRLQGSAQTASIGLKSEV